MLRSVALVLLLLAAAVRSQTQSPANPLPNEMRLDPDFTLTWAYDAENITIELYVATAGWVSLSLLSDDGEMLDVWWGGYDEDYQTPYIQDMYAFLAGLDIGPRYPDTVQNLQLINVIQPAFESTTRLRLVRRLSAPDYKQDVPTYIDGTRQIILWAYGLDDLPSSPAYKKGLAQVSWLP